MNRTNDLIVMRLYEKYWDRMKSYANTILNDPSMSEDITQIAFEKLIRYLDGLDFEPDDQHLEALLVVMTKRSAYDETRARKARKVISLIDEKDILDEIDMETMVVNATYAKEVCELLEKEMGDHEMRMLTLKYSHNYTLKEIAEEYGIKENHANQKIFRAKKKAMKIWRSLNE